MCAPLSLRGREQRVRAYKERVRAYEVSIERGQRAEAYKIDTNEERAESRGSESRGLINRE
jgi:hypothetical protein